MGLIVALVPVLADNYAYLVHDPASAATAVVDPGEAAPILAALETRGWTLSLILNTHHHPDHIGGNAALAAATGAPIYGPARDDHRIANLARRLSDGDVFEIGTRPVTVIDVPGHTAGHIALYCPQDDALFSGDTLFSLGCGRLFEGTPAEMWQSLTRLRALPDGVKVYCGHEYTQSNLRFAVTIEPENPALAERGAEIAALRADGKPTIPSLLGVEKATNPFLRADHPAVAVAVGLSVADPVAVFAAVRGLKDKF